MHVKIFRYFWHTFVRKRWFFLGYRKLGIRFRCGFSSLWEHLRQQKCEHLIMIAVRNWLLIIGEKKKRHFLCVIVFRKFFGYFTQIKLGPSLIKVKFEAFNRSGNYFKKIEIDIAASLWTSQKKLWYITSRFMHCRNKRHCLKNKWTFIMGDVNLLRYALATQKVETRTIIIFFRTTQHMIFSG